MDRLDVARTPDVGRVYGINGFGLADAAVPRIVRSKLYACARIVSLPGALALATAIGGLAAADGPQAAAGRNQSATAYAAAPSDPAADDGAQYWYRARGIKVRCSDELCDTYSAFEDITLQPPADATHALVEISMNYRMTGAGDKLWSGLALGDTPGPPRGLKIRPNIRHLLRGSGVGSTTLRFEVAGLQPGVATPVYFMSLYKNTGGRLPPRRVFTANQMAITATYPR